MNKEQLVELVTTGSAAEADQLAERLRRAGIGALANAEPVQPEPAYMGKIPALRYRSFVLVGEPDRERALAMIRAEQPPQTPQGSATTGEIEAELADGARRDFEGDEDCDRDGVPDESPEAWQNRDWSERWHDIADRGTRWFVRPALFALAAMCIYAMARCAVA
ncbi:MAG: hypothetical protein WAT39_04480 [Planctomycetota bacterium]